ncbi:hypothetical protein T07_390 [Trichinella nelsoni]|uniref:Uncharacterized protein n=1 Tax=Trichinella nelsoni TaxID=6336 RepID=A0A0V0RXT2_9BILA|nr:hypothetical protein T07_390 [Trichinella nelsoni]
MALRQISLSQSSSVRTNPYNELLVRFQCDMTKIIAADATQIALPMVPMFVLVT